MTTNRMLIAIDNSASSERAVTDVVRKMPDPSELHIILLHVLRPVPPEFLEHGGAAEPQEEQRLEAEQDAAQAAWRQQTAPASQPVFANALAILKAASIPEQAIETQIYAPVPGQDIAAAIADVARDNACDTVVVGQSSYTWLRSLFHSHTSDKLLQQRPTFQLWVVEEDGTTPFSI